MKSSKKKYHFIGIGGIGMSALAQILLEKKTFVSGSDLSLNDITRQLACKGAVIKKGHSAKYISASDTVIYSSAIQKTNPEFQAALALKCELMHRSELLLYFMQDCLPLVVTGTHGKTTTTSLLAFVLGVAGHDPSYAIGGLLDGTNGKYGRGDFFVAEADESDGTFLNYKPHAAIVTNLEPEHMDYFKTEVKLNEDFSAFFTKMTNPSLLFFCGDDANLKKIAHGRGISYGFGKECALRIGSFSQKGWGVTFDLIFEERLHSDIFLPLIGPYNAQNAAAVFGLCLKLGVPEKTIREALANFPGVDRRCQKRNEVNSVLFLDDYGHHPTEIEKTLGAVKHAVEERRVIVLFQPHRYTRTKENWDRWIKAFDWADQLFVTDIYSAKEPSLEGISGEKLVNHIKQNSTVPCSYIPKEQWSTLEAFLRPHDVFITFGAGDIAEFHQHKMTPQKFRVGLIFGGRSSEHEISLRSARFAAESLNREIYELSFFGIDKQGKWISGNEAEEILKNDQSINSSQSTSFLAPSIATNLEKCDVFVPILHGPFGEDGTLQGLFEMLGRPYVGPDHRSAAISMDKIITKRLVAATGVPVPNDCFFTSVEWKRNKEELLTKILTDMVFPLFVKPMRLGSSIAVSRIMSRQTLEAAIEMAFRVDTCVMVEEGKNDCRELEFAVLGNTEGYSIHVPGPGEKLAHGKPVDYEMKYGKNPVQTTIHPQLDEKVLQKGKEYALKAYRACGCNGMTRVDFLLDAHNNFWFFEMNGIPGMQRFSLFPKIWAREGVSAPQLFDKLIILALQRSREQARHCIPQLISWN